MNRLSDIFSTMMKHSLSMIDFSAASDVCIPFYLDYTNSRKDRVFGSKNFFHFSPYLFIFFPFSLKYI